MRRQLLVSGEASMVSIHQINNHVLITCSSFSRFFSNLTVHYSGLDICEQFMDVNDMIKDEDLILHNSHGNGISPRVYTSRNIQQLVANMVPSVLSKRPSPRELNLLKRKAKINSKDQSKGWSEDGDVEVACAQSMTTPKGSCPESFGTNKVLDC